ncbi:hypothetical protein JCM10450v2_005376 [Rhodotorula kratochvilovae]
MAPLDEPSQAASSSPRQFTLVSSDGQSFPVDAIQLVAASKVFADMVHVGQPADQPATCTLAEDAETVALFVKTLETWESPSEQKEWLTLYKMADKYDCPCMTPDHFYFMLLHVARRSLDNIGPDEACPCSYEEDSFMHENSAAVCWEESRAAVLRDLRADQDAAALMVEELEERRDHWGTCDECRREVEVATDELIDAYRAALEKLSLFGRD